MGFSSRSYAPQGYSSGSLPPGVRLLLIVNSALFLLYLLSDLANVSFLFRPFLLVPAQTIERFWLWQPVTYMFLHSPQDITHILLNMLMLWMFGAALEGAWGTDLFLRFYFLCGLGAAACVIAASYLFGSPGSATLGASGAIFGLLMAFGIVFAESTILVFFLFPLKAKYAVMIFGAVELFATIRTTGDGVSHVAHLGGMLFGYFYLRSFRNRRRTTRVAGLGLWTQARQLYQRWRLERAKRKFEVYMRKHRD
jgi:membrane associated rhomboid family serine protease